MRTLPRPDFSGAAARCYNAASIRVDFPGGDERGRETPWRGRLDRWRDLIALGVIFLLQDGLFLPANWWAIFLAVPGVTCWSARGAVPEARAPSAVLPAGAIGGILVTRALFFGSISVLSGRSC